MITDLFRYPADADYSYWRYSYHTKQWWTCRGPKGEVQWIILATGVTKGRHWYLTSPNFEGKRYDRRFTTWQEAVQTAALLTEGQMTAFWLLPNEGEDPL